MHFFSLFIIKSWPIQPINSNDKAALKKPLVFCVPGVSLWTGSTSYTIKFF